MSKIHYVLILSICLLVALSAWLLLGDIKEDEVAQEPVKTEAQSYFSDNRPKKAEPVVSRYVQGVIVVPDLEQDFKRCLNRGYDDIQKDVLRDARDAFSDKSFDDGKFSWNKVIFIDDLNEKKQYYLNEQFVLEISEFKDGKFELVKKEDDVSLDDFKEKLIDKKISFNLFSQKLTKGDLIMDLLLENGLLKSLIINSPKKRVVCKP